MENIIRITDLKQFVEETLNEIREGVAAARATGMIVELPEEVQFNVLLVKEWQALQIEGGGSEESTQSDSGGSKEIQNGTTTDARSETASDEKSGSETAEKIAKEVGDSRETSTKAESNDSQETASATSATSDITTVASQNSNAHKQTDETKYTYVS